LAKYSFDLLGVQENRWEKGTPKEAEDHTFLQKKGKVVLIHYMKAYKGSRGITPLILNPGTKWR
jgi:hypothetical protein